MAFGGPLSRHLIIKKIFVSYYLFSLVARLLPSSLYTSLLLPGVAVGAEDLPGEGKVF
jgi:hypothetical protein